MASKLIPIKDRWETDKYTGDNFKEPKKNIPLVSKTISKRRIKKTKK